MSIKKYPIRPDRIRQIPRNFSWIDRRILREKYLEKITTEASALYLVLIVVGDQCGISYYSDSSLSDLLRVSWRHFQQARKELIDVNLIVYEKPLYQVLCLEKKDLVLPREVTQQKVACSSSPPKNKTSRTHSLPGKASCGSKPIGAILQQILKGQ